MNQCFDTPLLFQEQPRTETAMQGRLEPSSHDDLGALALGHTGVTVKNATEAAALQPAESGEAEMTSRRRKDRPVSRSLATMRSAENRHTSRSAKCAWCCCIKLARRISKGLARRDRSFGGHPSAARCRAVVPASLVSGPRHATSSQLEGPDVVRGEWAAALIGNTPSPLRCRNGCHHGSTPSSKGPNMAG